ncbi:MAG: hypothetical protein R3248_13670 [Candidatus Promineifilaceae bacterium]|nr:hypothetical protein [Candidatus Promineifilaceae bacterium]
MKRWVFLLLSFLSTAIFLMACAQEEQAEPTATATPPASAATVTRNTVREVVITVTPRATPAPARAGAVRPLLSGPTPTAFPLPTRSTDVNVVTRVVEDEPRPEEGAPASSRLAVPADEEQVGASEHFTFYAEAGAQVPPEVGARAEEILEYVSRRLGVAYPGSIDVLLREPPGVPCPPRGMTLSQPPRDLQEAPIIYVFAGDETTREQIEGVLAHEVAHVLHARALAQGLSGNRALDEGFAHWLSADYVAAWYGVSSYDTLVRGYVEAGTYLPLYEHFELRSVYADLGTDAADCLQRRDQLYSQWGSFIDFLIETYGMESFRELMESPTRERSAEEVSIRPPDYEGVYGLALNQLEAAWLRHLLR